jgi:hypothetical protein
LMQAYNSKTRAITKINKIIKWRTSWDIVEEKLQVKELQIKFLNKLG